MSSHTLGEYESSHVLLLCDEIVFDENMFYFLHGRYFIGSKGGL